MFIIVEVIIETAYFQAFWYTSTTFSKTRYDMLHDMPHCHLQIDFGMSLIILGGWSKCL